MDAVKWRFSPYDSGSDTREFTLCYDYQHQTRGVLVEKRIKDRIIRKYRTVHVNPFCMSLGMVMVGEDYEI